MLKNKVPGLMRLNPRGVISPCNYDYDTQQIGYVKVKLPIAYASEYNPAACLWTEHDLWKLLLSRDDNVAALLLNNTFIITVQRNSLVVHTNRYPEGCAAPAVVQLQFEPTRPVGFVRTCPAVKDVNIPPYMLFMDDANRVSLRLGEFQYLPDAVPTSATQLYKTLITTQYQAVYQTPGCLKFL